LASGGRVYVRVIKVKGEVLVTACDEELLGKCFVDEEKGLRLEVKESFYKGEIMNPKDSISLIRKASVANLVGSRIIREALNIGIVKPKAVIKVAGVPHAQIVKM
jgi:hypothetical protein